MTQCISMIPSEAPYLHLSSISNPGPSRTSGCWLITAGLLQSLMAWSWSMSFSLCGICLTGQCQRQSVECCLRNQPGHGVLSRRKSAGRDCLFG